MKIKWNSTLMKVMIWITEMLYLQGYAWLGVLRGGIILGIFPSLLSLFDACRWMIRQDDHTGLKERFKTTYHREFWHANKLGFLLLSIFCALVIYFRMTTRVEVASRFFVFLGYGFIVLFTLMTLYILVIDVHLDLSIGQLFQHAFIIMLASPFHTFMMGGLFLLFLWSTVRWAILIPFVAISICIYGITYIALKAIEHLAKKQSGYS